MSECVKALLGEYTGPGVVATTLIPGVRQGGGRRFSVSSRSTRSTEREREFWGNHGSREILSQKKQNKTEKYDQ